MQPFSKLKLVNLNEYKRKILHETCEIKYVHLYNYNENGLFVLSNIKEDEDKYMASMRRFLSNNKNINDIVENINDNLQSMSLHPINRKALEVKLKSSIYHTSSDAIAAKNSVLNSDAATVH